MSRRPHPTDGRAQVVDLTDAGHAELARVRRLNAELVTARLADTHHTTEEVATAVAVMRDILRPNPQEDTL